MMQSNKYKDEVADKLYKLVDVLSDDSCLVVNEETTDTDKGLILTYIRQIATGELITVEMLNTANELWEFYGTKA